MRTAEKTGPEVSQERSTKSDPSVSSHPICPCLSVTTMHLGGCFFAATMLGAAVYGI